MKDSAASIARDAVAYNAAVMPRRLAVHDLWTDTRLNYAELDQRIAHCAGLLSGTLGTPFGQRVAMLARNSVEILVMHYACSRVGAIFQPLNWRLPGPELRVLIEDAEPGVFIYQAEFETAAGEALASGSVRHVFRIGVDEDELARAIDRAEPASAREIAPDTPITLLYSSGTTGRPKGIIVTQRMRLFCALNYAFASEVSSGDVLLCDVPMFHVAGLCAMSLSTMRVGGTLLISDRFEPRRTLERLASAELCVTHYFAAPQMAQALRADPAYEPSALRHLKAIIVGGGPVPAAMVERYLAESVPVVDGYGLSEAGTVFGMPLDPAVRARKLGSSGLPAPFIDVRLADTHGRDVGPGEVGEIWLKGPSVTPGYWKQPEASARVLAAGWLRTGDAALCDEEGYYWLKDRWKDMYISGGENVYPAEVEAALLELPEIAEAAVIGVKDPRWGESGCAYVVCADPDARTADEVIDAVLSHCRARLARYKVPKIVLIVESLPRTGSGKVRKGELRERYNRESNA